MKLMQVVGATPKAEQEDLQKIYPMLVQAAAVFLRGGGALSFYEWCDLQAVEKQAFAEAGDAVWSLRAAAIGSASQSPEAAAEVARPADNGESREQLELAKAAQAAAQAVGAR